MIQYPHFLAAFVVLLAGSAAWAVETVKVDVAGGAPRIVIDGRAARARVFWGAPGARPVLLTPERKQITFEFSPPRDVVGGATMHFRFGNVPGEVFIDSVSVVDIASGEEIMPVEGRFTNGMEGFGKFWNVWPVGAQNTVGTVSAKEGGLRVLLKAPADGKWPDFHIYSHAKLTLRKGHRYRVSLWASGAPGRKMLVAFYKPGQPYQCLGGPEGAFERQIKLAAGAGVNLVSFPVDMPWPAPGAEVDWSASDSQCQAVLDANPNALLIPRIGMDAPQWWLAAHPEETMVWDDGAHANGRATVASALYRREAAERLAAMIEHLEKKFGAHVAGYHPAGQNTGEWFYEDTWKRGLNGYAKADERAWREWLTERYRDDAGLRAAWRDPRVTLKAAEVPAVAARRGAPAGALRDPAAERPLIDFAEFQQRMMADCVCELAKAARRASGGRKLVLFFYGYVFEFGPVSNGPATAGHYALRRVLDCPDIDVLCSPISYFDRGMGQSAPSMTAAESVALAGKMWLNEDDTHTYLASGDPPGSADHVDTLEKTNQQLVRNTAQCALRNFGTWWMDLGADGWFDDAGMWEQMSRLAPLDQAMLERPRAFWPEVAAVIDERSMLSVAAGGQVVTLPGIYEARRALGRMGAPYGQYLLDDVLAGRVRAKVYVMLNAWRLSAEQRRQLLVATRGAVRVWCYAPGYHDEEGVSLGAMRELTGFALRPVMVPSAQSEPTAKGRSLGVNKGLGSKQKTAPLFAAVDAKEEEVLARYGDGSAAVAIRTGEEGVSMFVGPPGLSSELLRVAARQGGVHLFSPTDCNVYANGPWVVLHASGDGVVSLDTGRAEEIRDMLTDAVLGRGPKLDLQLTKGQTRVLRVGKD